jgi:hypothetical protein
LVAQDIHRVTENEAQERRAEEFVKLCFEFFKHLTTLGTAGALVVLAVYRELTFEAVLLALTLAMFGVTILTSVLSMMICTTYFSPSEFRPSEGVLGWLMAGASGSFIIGAESFMLFLIQWPRWVNVVLLPMVLLILVALTRRRLAFLRRSRRPLQPADQQDQARRQERD